MRPDAEWAVKRGDSMYDEWEQLCLDSKKEGWEKGLKKGVEEGMKRAGISALKNLMMNLNLSEEEAMNALQIPEAEREMYAELLSEQ